MTFEKATYRQKALTDLDMNNPEEIFSSKIDGAHSAVVMEKGKLPRLFSHRISKRTNEPIEYTQKLPHIQNKSPIDAVFRAEVFATDVRGKAVHPDVVTALLNSGLENSLALQKRMGIDTKTALIDVDSINGADVKKVPYAKKLEFMKQVVAKNPDFMLPDLARTKEEKEKLVSHIIAGTHPLTKEGVVIHDLNKPDTPFTKAKVVNDHDVIVRRIFNEEATKPGRQPMAGGFFYSWTPEGPIVGKVGTGFNHAMKKDMMENSAKYIGLTARVKALDVSKNKVLVKPSFHLFHVEKNLGDNDMDKNAKELTTNARENIAPKNFALEKKKKYPIEDLPHARNALARVSAYGTPSEKAEVRSDVYGKYPALKKRHEEKTAFELGFEKKASALTHGLAALGAGALGLGSGAYLGKKIEEGRSREKEKGAYFKGLASGLNASKDSKIMEGDHALFTPYSTFAQNTPQGLKEVNAWNLP